MILTLEVAAAWLAIGFVVRIVIVVASAGDEPCFSGWMDAAWDVVAWPATAVFYLIDW